MPFVAIYSTFLQRAYDQIVHDVAIQSLPVRFMIDRAGLVGQDGPTHAGSFDIAYLANLPNFICMAPSNGMDLADMILTAYEINDRPSSIRYPKRDTDIIEFNHKPKKIQIGKGEIVKQGKEIAILSLGTRLNEALLASKRLSDEGHDITVADAMFIKPLDKELIIKLANSHRILITVEEGVIGGFGSHVVQLLLNSGILEKGLKFRALFLPDRFIEHNDVNQMYEEAGLNSSGIYNVIKGLL
jgi:1-deoxy-D-xylulose-5-phosphate synthase